MKQLSRAFLIAISLGSAYGSGDLENFEKLTPEQRYDRSVELMRGGKVEDAAKVFAFSIDKHVVMDFQDGTLKEYKYPGWETRKDRSPMIQGRIAGAESCFKNKDYRHGIRAFALAAALGDTSAFHSLADAFDEGLGVEQNNDKAELARRIATALRRQYVYEGL